MLKQMLKQMLKLFNWAFTAPPYCDLIGFILVQVFKNTREHFQWRNIR